MCSNLRQTTQNVEDRSLKQKQKVTLLSGLPNIASKENQNLNYFTIFTLLFFLECSEATNLGCIIFAF